MTQSSTDPLLDESDECRFQVRDFYNALLAVDLHTARWLVQESCTLDSPVSCFETLIIPALDEIGKGWEQGSVALSQVYMSGKICEEIVDQMLPMKSVVKENQPKIAVVVLEDYHSLGKRILLSVLRASGYEVTDYGADVSVEILVKKVLEDQIRILLISALMLPAALKAREAIERIREKQPQTKIIVGGAPFRFDTTLYQEVHADAMGHTTTHTLKIVNTLAGGSDS